MGQAYLRLPSDSPGAKKIGSTDHSLISMNISKTIYSTQEDIVPSDKLVNVYSCSHSDGLANRQILPRAGSQVDGKTPYILRRFTRTTRVLPEPSHAPGRGIYMSVLKLPLFERYCIT